MKVIPTPSSDNYTYTVSFPCNTAPYPISTVVCTAPTFTVDPTPVYGFPNIAPGIVLFLPSPDLDVNPEYHAPSTTWRNSPGPFISPFPRAPDDAPTTLVITVAVRPPRFTPPSGDSTVVFPIIPLLVSDLNAVIVASAAYFATYATISPVFGYLGSIYADFVSAIVRLNLFLSHVLTTKLPFSIKFQKK